MSFRSTIKTIMDTVLFGRAKKRRTTQYWWDLHECARKHGLFSYLKRQEYRKLVDKYNAFIPLQASFASKPAMPHGINGIFISSGARIGHNCTIFHQVTIGSNTLADSPGAGAPMIGANCVVTTDIPSHCTVVMNKPRIIMKTNDKNTFVPYSGAEENGANETR